LGIMKKGCALAFAAAVLTLGANAARADFKLSYTVAAGTGALAGNNVFSFYARNDQTGPQAGSHTLLAMEIHFTTVDGKPFVFDFRDVGSDGRADANVFGKNLDASTAGGTFMRFGTYPDWIGSVLSPGEYRTDSGGTPAQTYANVTDLYAIGFSQNQALDATQGMGQFFGAAVVPDGTDVHVSGLMGAEQGTGGGVGSAPLPADLLAEPDAIANLLAAQAAAGVTAGPRVPVSLVARAPEPGSFAVLGAASLATLARRRRR
jgi:hypothetical protein